MIIDTAHEGIAPERIAPDPIAGVRFDPAALDLWRVVDARGRIIGHLQAVGGGRGLRYRARRFSMASRAFRDLGEFWTTRDAVECLRYG